MMLIPKFVSVDQVSPEALVTYSREVRAKTEKQLEPHKKLCDEWKVVFFLGSSNSFVSGVDVFLFELTRDFSSLSISVDY